MRKRAHHSTHQRDNSTIKWKIPLQPRHTPHLHFGTAANCHNMKFISKCPLCVSLLVSCRSTTREKFSKKIITQASSAYADYGEASSWKFLKILFLKKCERAEWRLLKCLCYRNYEKREKCLELKICRLSAKVYMRRQKNGWPWKKGKREWLFDP